MSSRLVAVGGAPVAGPSSSSRSLSTRDHQAAHRSATILRQQALEELEDDVVSVEGPADLDTVIAKLDALFASPPFHDIRSLACPDNPGQYTGSLIDALDLFAHVQLTNEHVSQQLRLALAKHLKHLKAGKADKALPAEIVGHLRELHNNAEAEKAQRNVYYAFSGMLRVMYLKALAIALYRYHFERDATRAHSRHHQRAAQRDLARDLAQEVDMLFPDVDDARSSEPLPLFARATNGEEQESIERKKRQYDRVIEDLRLGRPFDVSTLPSVPPQANFAYVKSKLLKHAHEVCVRQTQAEAVLQEADEVARRRRDQRTRERGRAGTVDVKQEEQHELVGGIAAGAGRASAILPVAGRLSTPALRIDDAQTRDAPRSDSTSSVRLRLPEGSSPLRPGTVFVVNEHGELVPEAQEPLQPAQRGVASSVMADSPQLSGRKRPREEAPRMSDILDEIRVPASSASPVSRQQKEARRRVGLAVGDVSRLEPSSSSAAAAGTGVATQNRTVQGLTTARPLGRTLTGAPVRPNAKQDAQAVRYYGVPAPPLPRPSSQRARGEAGAGGSDVDAFETGEDQGDSLFQGDSMADPPAHRSPARVRSRPAERTDGAAMSDKAKGKQPVRTAASKDEARQQDRTADQPPVAVSSQTQLHPQRRTRAQARAQTEEAEARVNIVPAASTDAATPRKAGAPVTDEGVRTRATKPSLPPPPPTPRQTRSQSQKPQEQQQPSQTRGQSTVNATTRADKGQQPVPGTPRRATRSAGPPPAPPAAAAASPAKKASGPVQADAYQASSVAAAVPHQPTHDDSRGTITRTTSTSTHTEKTTKVTRTTEERRELQLAEQPATASSTSARKPATVAAQPSEQEAEEEEEQEQEEDAIILNAPKRRDPAYDLDYLSTHRLQSTSTLTSVKTSTVTHGKHAAAPGRKRLAPFSDASVIHLPQPKKPKLTAQPMRPMSALLCATGGGRPGIQSDVPLVRRDKKKGHDAEREGGDDGPGGRFGPHVLVSDDET